MECSGNGTRSTVSWLSTERAFRLEAGSCASAAIRPSRRKLGAQRAPPQKARRSDAGRAVTTVRFLILRLEERGAQKRGPGTRWQWNRWNARGTEWHVERTARRKGRRTADEGRKGDECWAISGKREIEACKRLTGDVMTPTHTHTHTQRRNQQQHTHTLSSTPTHTNVCVYNKITPIRGQKQSS